MLTIYKYSFIIEDRFTIDLPRRSSILSVQCQAGTPCLWALVDPEAEPRPVAFRLFGTGHPIDPREAENLDHIATFLQGPFVWHLFRVMGTGA